MPDTIIYASLSLLLLPFLGFAFLLIFPKPLVKKEGAFSLSILGLCLMLSILLFDTVWNLPAQHGVINWFSISNQTWQFSWTLDNYSAIMLLVVSLITFLVMLFSVSYMKGDRHYGKYFAYLCLFAGAMIGLVFMQNLVLVYAFWELVGLASYLLIGFWQEKQSAAKASQKAFLVNRIGDAGFLIGIIALYQAFGTLDIPSMEIAITKGILAVESNPWMLLAAFGITAGALGKSAQLPFSVWLPDAMAGPTPVSALLHAATMVAAGVYLLARVHFLLPIEVHTVILMIGACTAVFGSFAAIAQYDLKKILAYSTISQLGYMFMAIGIGAPALAMFHLLTHAFFKACLFLGAGAIIHSVQYAADSYGVKLDPQDIRMMGGLKKHIPIIFITFAIASLSLAGMPLFSGFLSKDAILITILEAAQHHSFFYLPLILGLIAAGMTSFYVGRMLMKVFGGTARHEALGGMYLHDADQTMRWPLIVLATGSLWIWFAWNPLEADHGWFLHVVAPELTHGAGAYVMMGLSAVLAISGLLLAKRIYAPDKNIGWADHIISEDSLLHKLSSNAWYLNNIYLWGVRLLVRVVSRILVWLDQKVINRFVEWVAETTVVIAHVISWIDRYIVDGLVRLSAYTTGQLGKTSIAFLHQGKAQSYIVWLIIALLGLMWIFI